MQIALVHYSAPPIVGGVESVLAQHARLMADANHFVCVLAGRGAGWDDRLHLILNPLLDSRHPEVLAAKAALDSGVMPASFIQLRNRLIEELAPVLQTVEVVVAHNVCSLHKNLALTAALYTLSQAPGAPRFILWHHDLAWLAPRYRAELHPGYPWDLLRQPWPGVTHVAVSELRRRELAELLRLPPPSMVVVPNGVDRTTFLKLEAQTHTLSNTFGLINAEPLLLLPVRLTSRKNIELALHALAELRQSYPHAMLLVTGPPGPHNPANVEYQQRLLALRDELGLRGAAHFVAEHVAEFLPDAVVADFFRLADALLLPSREEGFGIPLIEAAFSRLPVFCTDIPSLRELGAEEVTYFAPDADPAQLAHLIMTRLQNDPVYQFAVRARQRFTWERVYEAYIAPLLSPEHERLENEA